MSLGMLLILELKDASETSDGSPDLLMANGEFLSSFFFFPYSVIAIVL